MTKTPNPGGLPRGAGSMQKRKLKYWLIYADQHGRRVQENSGTDDPAKARRILTQRAIAVLEARLSMLREVLREQHGQGDPRSGAGGAGKRRRAGASAEDHARNRTKGTQRGTR